MIFDDKGKYVTQEYSPTKTFIWEPVDPGEYTIYGRVRYVSEHNNKEEENKIYLKNSYEKEASDTIRITDEDVGIINIENVYLNDFDILSSNGAVAYEANYFKIIDIDINDNRLMYKIYAIHDGMWQTLTNYTYNNEIPFVPKDR